MALTDPRSDEVPQMTAYSLDDNHNFYSIEFRLLTDCCWTSFSLT